jgi:hypothetical protein
MMMAASTSPHDSICRCAECVLVQGVEKRLMGLPQAGDVGHLLGDDEPLIVFELHEGKRLTVMDASGARFPTTAACFVIESAGLDSDLIKELHVRWILEQ